MHITAFTGWVLVGLSIACASDPLPSWRDGDAKRALMAFVERVAEEDSKDFVPVPERIAVFDNDGTLWCENPLPNQVAFAIAEIERMLPSDPDWKDDPAVLALLRGDTGALTADHHQGLIRILALTHAGMTVDAFEQRVRAWLQEARHPRLARPYTRTTYQPMLEVLDYLGGEWVSKLDRLRRRPTLHACFCGGHVRDPTPAGHRLIWSAEV